MRDADQRKPPLAARLAAGAIARLYLRRPEMAEVIAIRYRSLRALLLGVGNELAYRLGLRRAPGLMFTRPWLLMGRRSESWSTPIPISAQTSCQMW